ncbi:MAG: ribosome-associated translation inhibitor RaiA [Planctomycetota bacterium]|jgi:ribosomal subunit interface protein|nr:ribosome-associated translation inhibitor RaiA [Planctomycetota bacterium]
MNIQLTAKKIEIPSDVREEAKEKFARLVKFNPRIQSVEVVVEAEERRIGCEAIIRLDSHDSIVIEVYADTIQGAVDVAIVKCERQLRKTKERDSARRRANKNDRVRDGGEDLAEV